MHQGIARHKTAISRAELSRPVKFALADGLLTETDAYFDYGCGRGNDLERLRAMGFADVQGWDPVHNPAGVLRPSAVVNLGYVINVIEDPRERRETLQKAWELAESLLIVSARLTSETKALGETEEFADGCLTSLGTFQKFYEQHELKTWIEQSIETKAVPAGPGVFYAFRDEEARVAFQSSRHRRRIAAPRLSRSVQLFNQHEDVLAPLMAFVTDRGRLPADDELPNAQAVHQVFGSTKRAFRVVELATEKAQWDAIREGRAQELLIYLALSQFDGRPIYSRLPRSLQLDVKSFYSRYNKACAQADELLFSIGDMATIDRCCESSALGKKLPGALYIHDSVLEPISKLPE